MFTFSMILALLIYGAAAYITILVIKALRRLIRALDIYISKNS